ncbi:nuclear transport factor 2 family protein [Micromonospora sp. NPDC023737]|uniref:YybH family protein n=1 Tax=unclassified Micromonospora TaxID=2617518 RepID=UPI0033CA5B72
MRRTTVTAVLSAALAAGLPAAAQLGQPTQSDRAAGSHIPGRQSFDAAVAAHLRAIVQRDLPGYAATLAPQVQLVLPDASVVSGKDAVVEVNREFFADRTWRLEATEVARGLGDRAGTVVYQFSFVYALPDGSTLRGTSLVGLTFVCQRGRWLLLHDQNTRAQPTPEQAMQALRS